MVNEIGRPLTSESDTWFQSLSADVYWLAPLRHALTFAGLIARRSGFRITSPARALLQPERAGELCARLFLTVFRHLNLRLVDCDRHPGPQSTVAYTLYRLGLCARDGCPRSRLSTKRGCRAPKIHGRTGTRRSISTAGTSPS